MNFWSHDQNAKTIGVILTLFYYKETSVASEQVRMIASWLPTRSWQTILPTISTHTYQATKPVGAMGKPGWKDTRSSMWAQKATAGEKKRWNEMHYPGWNEAVTSDEEDWQWGG